MLSRANIFAGSVKLLNSLYLLENVKQERHSITYEQCSGQSLQEITTRSLKSESSQESSAEAAPYFQLLWLGIEDGRAKSLFHEHPTTFVTLNSQSPWPMLLMITTVKYLMRKNGTLTRHPFGIWKAGPCKIQYSPYNP